MSGRNAFATPTNVYPKNGQSVVMDSNDMYYMSFTNNSDAIAFVRFAIYDATTDEWIRSVFCRWFNSQTFSITSNRGDSYYMGLERDPLYAKELIDGRHYKYNITLYGCYPHEVAGGYTLQPNCTVNFASGEIYEVLSSTQFRISPGIYKIEVPIYWSDPYVSHYPDVTENLIGCCYMRIGHEERMITSYDISTGLVEIFTPFSEEYVGTGVQFFLNCNYISTSGSESEGTYDFYVRQNIQQVTDVYPVPWGLQCASTYSHPNRVGLENYRFKVYTLIGDGYINGTIQSPTTGADGNSNADNRHIPLETGIVDNLINKRILIGKIEQAGQRIQYGEGGEIVNYDSRSGIATLRQSLSTFPTAGLPYTIDLSDRQLLSDSDNCYSYHLHYNFPVYTLGKHFQIETILTTYEKQTLDTCINISVPVPENDFDYGQVNDEYYIGDYYGGIYTHNIYLEFKDSLANDDRFFGIYRRETGKTVWNYLGYIYKGNSYIDYLAANNTNYDYLISRSVSENTTDYNPANEYKAHAFENAVKTAWDGWTITAIYPCENEYISDTIDNVRQSKSLSDTLKQYVCNKTPYKVGETWTFVASIDSGEIVTNNGRTMHVGTSTYPSITSTNNRYHSGSFSTDILTIGCESVEIQDNIQRVNKWIKFINDDCLFILKSDKGDVWIIAISENTSRSYDESVEPILTKVSYSWVEVDLPENIQIIQY